MDNRKIIDDLLLTGNNAKEALDAFKEITDIQKGSKFIKTGVDHLDYFLIDGMMGKFVFIGARPSQGKTHLGSRIIKNILDPTINDGEYAVLRFNWEMATKSLLLRSLKEKLNRGMRDILSRPFEGKDEQDLVREVVDEYRHPKIRNISNIFENDDLRYLLDKFCTSVENDVKKIIVIDHIHILPDKKRIDSFLTILNEYKMKYPNLGFIIFFQLNRELETIWRGGKDSKANPKNFRPNSSHIYNTDMLFQLADIIMTLVIPQVVNLDSYASINKEYHENLEEHYVKGNDTTNWVRLEGRNRIYYDYIKVRMTDDFEDPRLYCEILNENREQKIKIEANPLVGVPQKNTPSFMREDSITQDIIMGESAENDDLPF